MKGLIIWLAGFLPGIPLGFILRMIWVRPPKKQCKFIRETVNSSDVVNFDRCTGAETTSCVEHLCPAHCKVVHGDKCSSQLFAEARIH